MITQETQSSEKERLASDIADIQAGFDEIFKKSSETTQLALGSHEDSKKILTVQQRDKLVGLGFTNLANVEEFEENSRILEEAGATIEVVNGLKKIKTTYEKDIISYTNLVNLCKKYNLYFGDSSLFTGKMPEDNVKELNSFDFGKFYSQNKVISPYAGRSIVESYGSSGCKTMIVAPINTFKLQDVYIAPTREIIKMEGVNGKLKSPCGEDPIVLLPFLLGGSKEVFFLVVTHWEHSKSLI